MPEAAKGSKFIELLRESGVLPPNTQKVTITADCDDVIRGYFVTLPDGVDVATAAIMQHIEFPDVREMILFCRGVFKLVEETEPVEEVWGDGTTRVSYRVDEELMRLFASRLGTIAAWMEWANWELTRQCVSRGES